MTGVTGQLGADVLVGLDGSAELGQLGQLGAVPATLELLVGLGGMVTAPAVLAVLAVLAALARAGLSTPRPIEMPSVVPAMRSTTDGTTRAANRRKQPLDQPDAPQFDSRPFVHLGVARGRLQGGRLRLQIAEQQVPPHKITFPTLKTYCHIIVD